MCSRMCIFPWHSTEFAYLENRKLQRADITPSSFAHWPSQSPTEAPLRLSDASKEGPLRQRALSPPMPPLAPRRTRDPAHHSTHHAHHTPLPHHVPLLARRYARRARECASCAHARFAVAPVRTRSQVLRVYRADWGGKGRKYATVGRLWVALPRHVSNVSVDICQFAVVCADSCLA